MVARAEILLLLVFAAGILMVAQPWLPGLYRAGLLSVVLATLLMIAVGNVPPGLPPARALGRAGLLLLVLAAVFAAGYLLVPVLARLGR